MQTPYHLLTRSAKILPATRTLDDSNVPATAWAAPASVSATVACRIDSLSSDQALQYDRETASQMYTCLMAPVDSAGTALTRASIPSDYRIYIDPDTYLVQGEPMERRGNGGTIVLLNLTLRREGGLT